MAVPTGATGSVIREQQKARILKQGGKVLKFTNNGGQLYFRYYFPDPVATLTWKKLISGLRVLYSIPSSDVFIRYIDTDGSKITVSDDGGLRIMFDETKSSDVIRIEVVRVDKGTGTTSLNNSGNLHSGNTPNGTGGINSAGTNGANGKPLKMTMPMPMHPSGFPGVDASRPVSSMSHANPPTGQQPTRPHAPGPMSQPAPNTYGPNYNNSNGHGYGTLNTSLSTLPPPKPQEPLD